MSIHEGDQLPNTTLRIMRDGRLAKASVHDLVRGKKVVIFAVPGAFTPTCSEQHLPGFVRQAEAIKAKGVDEIVCVAVNDVFVMDAWGREQDADEIVMASDGNGEFTQAIGLVLDGSSFGLGSRSERYAMIVEDGTVTKLAVEGPGKFEVSNAESILDAL
ncbi:MAG: peroxiredoxin [Gammaproteobacteria bacterium]|nr:peroxiredoxin [Gammaproteobacteria bacterium]MYF02209.1 peroxiredoxin [Gammaproteobacteria bacterium]MYI76372.1 peroxiredoxin [Gammaproteobacteria bacterium]